MILCGAPRRLSRLASLMIAGACTAPLGAQLLQDVPTVQVPPEPPLTDARSVFARERDTGWEEGRRIAWASAEGADIANSGRVTFQEAGARGTVVTATILSAPPAGVIGRLVATLFQRDPAIQARRDLARFKQLMETGEVATNAMNPKQREEQGA